MVLFLKFILVINVDNTLQNNLNIMELERLSIGHLIGMNPVATNHVASAGGKVHTADRLEMQI